MNTVDYYKCEKCKEEWHFFPEDYEDTENYPNICPLCSMPLKQLFQEVRQEEGFLEAIATVMRKIILGHV